MRSIKYILPFPPIPWKRAGRNGDRYYDQQKVDKTNVGLLLANLHHGQPLFSGPTKLDIIFYMRHTKISLKENRYWYTEKPDRDNCEKFLCDAMNGILITDDRIICSGNIDKVYDKIPRVEFTLTELE